MKFWKKFMDRKKQSGKVPVVAEAPTQPKPVFEWAEGQEKVIPSFCLLVVNKQCNFHLIKSNHFNEIEAGHEGKINVIMHAY